MTTNFEYFAKIVDLHHACVVFKNANNRLPYVLYVNGCSNTYGEELQPTTDDPTPFNEYRINKSFSGLVAKRLKYDFVFNRAACGASNDRIVRTIVDDISTIASFSNVKAMIGFTTPYRLEMFDQESNKYRDIHLTAPGPTDIDHKNFNLKVAEFYLDNCFSQEQMGRKLIQQYQLVEKYLKFFCNNSFLVLNTLEPISGLDSVSSTKETPNYFLSVFHLFATTNNYRLGKNKHPLEEAHAAYANKIVQHLERHFIL